MLFAQLSDQLSHLDDLLGVQAEGRLVEDQHFRIVNDGLRQSHALSQALGERADQRVGPVLDVARFHRPQDGPRAVWHPSQAGHIVQVGAHAHLGVQGYRFRQVANPPAHLQGVAEHHLETSDTSIWGYITSAADAISSARPGARRESLESYLKRLRALEDIADSFKGVEKSYAIQAGREVRILVKPESIDDLGAMRLARDIVKKVEETLDYPGQIKVTVIRETRAIDYAK